jgi:hypothetical protein
MKALAGRRGPIDFMLGHRTEIEKQIQQGHKVEVNLQKRTNLDNNLRLFGYRVSRANETSQRRASHYGKLMDVFLRTCTLLLFLHHHAEISYDREFSLARIDAGRDDWLELLLNQWVSDPKEFVAMWRALR